MNGTMALNTVINEIIQCPIGKRINRATHFAYALKRKGVSYHSFLDELLDILPGTASLVIENFHLYGYLSSQEYEYFVEKRHSSVFISGLRKTVSTVNDDIEIAALYLSAGPNKKLSGFLANRNDKYEDFNPLFSGVIELIDDTPQEKTYFIRLLYCAYSAIEPGFIIEQIKNYTKQFLLDEIIPNELINFYQRMLRRKDFNTLYRLSDIYVDLIPEKVGVSNYDLIQNAVSGDVSRTFKRIVRTEQILRRSSSANSRYLYEWWNVIEKFKDNKNIQGIWPLLFTYKQMLFIASDPGDISDYISVPLLQYKFCNIRVSHYDYSHLYYDAVKYLSIAENEAYMAVFRDNPTRLRDLRLYLSKWNMFEYDAGVPRIELPYVNFRFSDSLTKMRSDGLSRAEMIDVYMNTSLRENVKLQLLMSRLSRPLPDQNTFNIVTLFEPYKIRCHYIDWNVGILPNGIKASPLKCSEGTIRLLKRIYDEARELHLNPLLFIKTNIVFYIAEYNAQTSSISAFLKTPETFIQARLAQYRGNKE